MKSWTSCSTSDAGPAVPPLSLLLAALIALLAALPGRAQELRNASGTAQFRLEDSISKEELREKLRRQAMIHALENEFGSRVEQESFVQVEDGIARFRITGNNTIRGEWLKTLSENFSERLVASGSGRKKQHELWMRCDITGLVRSAGRTPAALEILPADCPSDTCATGSFHDGQPLYLVFRSPVCGYLSVFLAENDLVYRLLPYVQMDESYRNAVPVDANRTYTFFSASREHDFFPGFSPVLADEMVLYSENPSSLMNLYVVFSEEPFQAPGTEYRDPEQPKSLETAAFREWLTENRIRTDAFQYRNIALMVLK
jgi:hypothetical protein